MLRFGREGNLGLQYCSFRDLTKEWRCEKWSGPQLQNIHHACINALKV